MGIILLTGSQVRTRYSVCRNTLLNWTNNIDDFPRPIVIRGRNYWRLADLEAWEANRVADGSGGRNRSSVAA